MFAVVKFTENDQIEVVPASWFSNGICLWPPVRTHSLQRSAKLVTKLAPAHSRWDKHPAELKGKYATHEEANRKADLALETSDINSEPEAKRKRIPNRRYKSASSSSELDSESETATGKRGLNFGQKGFSLPAPPILNAKPNTQPDPVILGRKSYPPNESEEELLDQYLSQESPSSYRKALSGASNFIRSSRQSASENIPGTDNRTPLLFTPPSRGNSQYSSDSNSTGPQPIANVPVSALVSINSNLEQINGLLTSISERLGRIERGSSSSIGLSATKFGFPISEMSKLRDLNDEYCANHDMQKELRTFLSSFGGKTITTCTTRILHEIFTDNLANQLSWSGRTKIGLSTFVMHTAIIDAVLNNFGGNGTRNGIEEIVKNWLSHAAERLARKAIHQAQQ